MAYRCGSEGVRLHDARHTHASLMLKQGIHPKIVQERLGHMSIQTTLDPILMLPLDSRRPQPPTLTNWWLPNVKMRLLPKSVSYPLAFSIYVNR